MQILQQLSWATAEVLKTRKYRTLAVAVAVAMLALYIMLPVVTIPGNDLALQLSATPPLGLFLMAVLAASMGLLIAMQLYIYKLAKSRATVEAGKGVATGFTSVVSAVFSTATCTSCIAAIFPFLGSGAILFLVQHQWQMVSVTLGLVLLSLYFASRKVVRSCVSCGVKV
ncbi:MAG: hypothetical protein HYX24_01835 [Candidatus Aenigmarchaeota archaeon]|nr:hypothetical protein [Candidatus Aenigmarchaeota archaeon]